MPSDCTLPVDTQMETMDSLADLFVGDVLVGLKNWNSKKDCYSQGSSHKLWIHFVVRCVTRSSEHHFLAFHIHG